MAAVETLRHLVFVHEVWFGRCCLGSSAPLTPFGTVPDYVLGHEPELDPTATPSLDEVVEIRDRQAAELDEWLSTVTPEELALPAHLPEKGRWPPYAQGKSILDCLRGVLHEEWAHHGFCERDLALLDA